MYNPPSNQILNFELGRFAAHIRRGELPTVCTPANQCPAGLCTDPPKACVACALATSSSNLFSSQQLRPAPSSASDCQLLQTDSRIRFRHAKIGESAPRRRHTKKRKRKKRFRVCEERKRTLESNPGEAWTTTSFVPHLLLLLCGVVSGNEVSVHGGTL